MWISEEWELEALAVDDQNNVYVAQAVYKDECHIFKFTPESTLTWVSIVEQGREPVDMTVDAAGNVYVTGNYRSTSQADDFFTVKLNADGEEQWRATYSSADYDFDDARSISVDEDGNVYVAGYAAGVALVKYDPDGNELWTNVYEYLSKDTQPKTERGGKLSVFTGKVEHVVNDAGEVFVAAKVTYPDNSDVVLIKCDADGHGQWLVNVDLGRNDYLAGLALDPDGNAVIAGISYLTQYDTDAFIAKYDPDGLETWFVQYDGAGEEDHEGAYAMAVDEAGNIYISGVTSYPEYGGLLAKYNGAGSELWAKTYTFDDYEHVEPTQSMVLDETNHVYLASSAYNYESFDDDTYDDDGVDDDVFDDDQADDDFADDDGSDDDLADDDASDDGIDDDNDDACGC